MNNEKRSTPIIYCGIDICGERLDVYCSQTYKQYDFSKKGVRRIKTDFGNKQSKLVLVYESTGYLSKDVRKWARELKIEQCCVNPARVRSFARSKGILAKTDKLDAQCIVAFAEAMDLQAEVPPTAQQEALSEYLTHQDLLISELSKLKTKFHACSVKTIKQSIMRMIKSLEQEIAKSEEAMKKIVEADQELKERYDIYRDIKGVGPRGAMSMLVRMPELGTLNKKEVASLLGVAPYNRESGETRWKRRIGAGRGNVRKILYLCCVCAIRCNPILKERYLQLINHGKKKKVAIIACVRKLIIHANSLIKQHLVEAKN